jgi:hypothetical protein
MALIEHRQKQRKVPATIKVVVEMPSDVITGAVVEKDGQGAWSLSGVG